MKPVTPSRKRSRHSEREWQRTAATASLARSAAHRFSASNTRPTKPTTVPHARPAESYSPIVACRAFSRMIGRSPSRNSSGGNRLIGKPNRSTGHSAFRFDELRFFLRACERHGVHVDVALVGQAVGQILVRCFVWAGEEGVERREEVARRFADLN